MKKTYFTLIELLLVITIIAVLSSMLLPAFNKARNSAKSIKCVSNFKQLAVVNINYQSDHNGFMYNYYDGKNVWYVVLGENGYMKERYFYTKNNNILSCPIGSFGAGVRWNYYMSTGFNAAASCKNFMKLSKPSMFISNADAHSYFFVNSDWSSNTPSTSSVYGAGLAWMHGNSTNILLADGHTEAWGLNKAYGKWSNIGSSFCLVMFNYTHNCMGY